jgi:tetratricopeptide (TPR) repeat protein
VLYGILLSFGVFVLGIAGAALGWYPSRVGGPAYWLDDHLYGPALTALSTAPTWPANAGFLYALGLLLAFAGYIGGWRWASRMVKADRSQLACVLAVQAFLCAWLWVQPYLSSQDIFSYAFYAHILTWYHANPYVAVPRDFPFDPLFGAIFWKDQPSNYGPLWTYLSAIVSLLAGTRSGVTVAALRVLAGISGLAGTPLIWSVANRIDPERRLAATILWAWNPLLLIESAGAGHNDIVMALFVVASLACWFSGRRTGGIAFLVLACLTKYVAVILIPLYLLAWLKAEPGHRVAAVVKTVTVGAALTVASYVPIYAGPSTLSIVGFGSNPLAYINSPLEIAFRDLRIALGEPSEIVNLPLHYLGFWVAGGTSVVLWEKPATSNSTAIALPTNEPLLVVESPSGEWLHVYEPRLGRFGYVHSNEVGRISAPRVMAADPSTEQVIEGAELDPRAVKSNLALRVLSAGIFLAIYILLLRRATDGPRLVRVSLTVLLLYLMVVQSWFWPWYLIWALPFAVFAMDTVGGRALLALTATASILNVQPSISPPPSLDWLLQARMLAIDGGPFLGVVAAYALGRENRWLTGRITRIRFSPPHLAIPRENRRWFAAALALALAVAFSSEAYLSLTSGANRNRALVVPWEQDYFQAQQYLAAGNYAGAAMAASSVLRAQPRETSAIQLRISANLAMRRYADVIPDLSQLLADDPLDAELLLERAEMYDQIQREDRAHADYARVIALAPSDPAGYVGIGTVDFREGDLDSATLWLSRALQIEPGRPDAERQLAAVLAAAGRPRQALILYDASVRQDPLDASAYAERAAVLSQIGPPSVVASDLRRVLTLSGDVQVHRWAADHLSQSPGGVAAQADDAG